MKKRGEKWTFNDDDRELFVSNHEPLYLQMRRSGKGLTAWVKQNRKEIDEIYIAMLNAKPER